MVGRGGKNTNPTGKNRASEPPFPTFVSGDRDRPGRCRSASRRRNLRPCVFYAFFCGQYLFRIFHNVQAQRRLPYTGCPALLLDFLLVQPPTPPSYHTRRRNQALSAKIISSDILRRKLSALTPVTPSTHCSNSPFPHTPLNPQPIRHTLFDCQIDTGSCARAFPALAILKGLQSFSPGLARPRDYPGLTSK